MANSDLTRGLDFNTMARIKDNTNELLKHILDTLKEKLTSAALVVERRAKQFCPRRTGTLVRSITHEIKDKSAFIGSNVEYAPIVELGSRPHIIRPNVAGALYWKGAEHPVKIVHHPGTRPKPYLRPALESSIPDIKKIFGAK